MKSVTESDFLLQNIYFCLKTDLIVCNNNFLYIKWLKLLYFKEETKIYVTEKDFDQHKYTF